MIDESMMGFALVKRTINKWREDKVSQLAAALAYFTILSLPSVLVLAILVAGLLVGEQDARSTLISEAGRVMGSDGREAIRGLLETAERPQGVGVAALSSLAVLVFSASGVFVQLQEAMNTIYGVEPDPDQGLINNLRRRLVSFLAVIALGLLLAVILIINSLVSLLAQSLSAAIPVGVGWIQILNFAVSFIVLVVIITLVFKYIPDVTVATRDAVIGGFVTAVLFIIGVGALTIYFRFSDPTSGFGVAGSLIALFIWVYYSAQIFFLGAEFMETFANRFGDRLTPEDDAVWAAGQEPQYEQVLYYEE